MLYHSVPILKSSAISPIFNLILLYSMLRCLCITLNHHHLIQFLSNRLMNHLHLKNNQMRYFSILSSLPLFSTIISIARFLCCPLLINVLVLRNCSLLDNIFTLFDGSEISKNLKVFLSRSL
jgi:hypothetical protein